MSPQGILSGGDVIASLRGVNKTYDGSHFVVTDLNLDIHRGELLTLLGPSGSGKSTTLMMIAGFEMPTSGTILLNGEAAERKPPHRRDIGVVFQNYALFPHMSVAENIAYPLRARKVPKAETATRVREALDRVQLRDMAGRKPGQLSGGQQQRVALARALVFEPKLILMDEPLGALDKKLREQLQVEIRAIQQSLGLTVVYVTHDQTEALTLSDRVAVFANGLIEQLSSPADIYARPRNSFIASFMGENNLLECVVEDGGNGTYRVRLKGGATATCVSDASFQIGQEAILAMRPELASLQAVPRENLFAGKVTRALFMGDHWLIHVDTDAGALLVKDTTNASGAAPGDTVSVSWSSRDSLILPN